MNPSRVSADVFSCFFEMAGGPWITMNQWEIQDPKIEVGGTRQYIRHYLKCHIFCGDINADIFVGLDI